jgi:hypothetical protein
MNGNALIGGGPVTPNPGPSRKGVATGDFTDAGIPTFCFRTRRPARFALGDERGEPNRRGKVSANPGPNWHVIGTGADGSDILRRNVGGQASIWEMNGNTIAGDGPVTPNPAASWRAVGLT